QGEVRTSTAGEQRSAEPRIGAARAEQRPVAATADDEQRTEVPAAAAGGFDRRRLLVVDAATRAPVPAAEVFWTDERHLRERRRPPGAEGDDRHWAERVVDEGVRLVADRQGQVLLPAIDARLFVAARRDALFGIATIDRNERDATVELDADRVVTVRVTDQTGRPCPDVEVVLGVDRAPGLDRCTTARTGADGVARLPHLQLHRRRARIQDPAAQAQLTAVANRVAVLERLANDSARVRGRIELELREQLQGARGELRQVARGGFRRSAAEAGAAAPGFADFVLLARVPQLTPAVVRFPAEVPPTDVVELRIGALGALTLRLLGPGGAPLWSPCEVELARSTLNPLPGSVEAGQAEAFARLGRMRQHKP